MKYKVTVTGPMNTLIEVPRESTDEDIQELIDNTATDGQSLRIISDSEGVVEVEIDDFITYRFDPIEEGD